MILVDWDIKRAMNSGEIEISNFSEKCLQPASYDLRVGEEGFTLSVSRVINIQNEGLLEIQPGDFALVMTHEKLRLPTNLICLADLVCARNTHGWGCWQLPVPRLTLALKES